MECGSSARAPGRGGGEPRGGSAGSQPGGAAPAAHPAARRPPPARSPLEARELYCRPSPALPPSLPPSSSLLGPGPRSTSLVFSKLPRPGLFVLPRSPRPRPRSPASSLGLEPARARPGCAGEMRREGASRAVVHPLGAAWWLGAPRRFALDVFLIHLRGRGTGSKKNPWVPAPALIAPGCLGLPRF